jgi:hypothetical protein
MVWVRDLNRLSVNYESGRGGTNKDLHRIVAIPKLDSNSLTGIPLLGDDLLEISARKRLNLSCGRHIDNSLLSLASP